jgi:prephenate dehydrogenase
LVVIGVGLIGGSFALALREKGLVTRVVGVGRSTRNLQAALKLGVIDEAANDPAAAVSQADLVLLAAPVGQMAEVMTVIAPRLSTDTIITDAGSTKQDVIANARARLGEHIARFVPAHPIAGAETSGAGAARADLYRGRRLIVTPLPENEPGAVELVRALWRACGSNVHEMPAQTHDEIFAAVSHLPHVLAYALVDLVAGRPNGEALLDFAGGGFRDCTRVAASPAEMWRDICLANRVALLKDIDAYQAKLAQLREMLAVGDAGALEQVFERAGTQRRRLGAPADAAE